MRQSFSELALEGQVKSQEKPLPSLRYRSDIEGLRAIAILLVVAAHAKVPWLAGGFIGVDVFFVLSGYLISGLLLREVEATGEIRLASFYARRLRRLLPGLLWMLLVVSGLAYLLIIPSEQPEQAAAAASAAAWLSNFHFALSDMDYFSPGAETNLFLHTWSLGVEEQFYLVWPLLLVAAMGAWSDASRPPNVRRLKVTLAVVFVFSLWVCLWWMHARPQWAFYMMPARAWQFALGTLTWVYFGSNADTQQAEQASSRLAHGKHRFTLLIWLGWSGLALIVIAALLLNRETPYPSTLALLPSVGAAMVLIAGARNTPRGIGSMLSLGPLQAIGRVSYSWYLWHWPVLLLGAAMVSTERASVRLLLVLISLALATLSYRLVETPLRHNPRLVSQPRLAMAAAVAVMITSAAGAIRWHSAAIDRMQSLQQARHQQARDDAPVIYGMGCDDWYHSAQVRICAFGPKDAPHTAVAMGDSIGLQWFPAFAKIFGRPSWRLLVLTKSSCPMVDEPYFYPRIGRAYTECAQWRRDALRQVAALKPDFVVLGSTFTYDFTPAQWQAGTARVLQSLTGSVGRIAILRSTPTLPFDAPSCAVPRSWLYSVIAGSQHCAASAASELSDHVLKSLEAAAAGFANVRIVDMTDVICPDGVCHAERDGMIMFRDSQHLSATFAAGLGDELGDRLDVPRTQNVP